MANTERANDGVKRARLKRERLRVRLVEMYGRVPLACQPDLRSGEVDAYRIASPVKRGSCCIPGACCHIENVGSSANARVVECKASTDWVVTTDKCSSYPARYRDLPSPRARNPKMTGLRSPRAGAGAKA